MKLLLAIVLLTASFTATAGVRCSTDQWGNTTCRNDDGYTQRWSTDQWGNSTGHDSNGNTMRCSSDQWGNTTCN